MDDTWAVNVVTAGPYEGVFRGRRSCALVRVCVGEGGC